MVKMTKYEVKKGEWRVHIHECWIEKMLKMTKYEVKKWKWRVHISECGIADLRT
jgi:hypothetical protein